jgi:hypothetical protein
LDTFLAKFNNCAKFFKWSDNEQLFFLKASLDGQAGQLLWHSDSVQDTVEKIIELLQNRFGQRNQAERYRAELRIRKQQKNESLQSLYQDVCRLMSLAYIGPITSTIEIVAHDAFLEALDDSHLRVRILEREPKNLEEALKIATRLEAFDKAGVSSQRSSNDESGRQNVRQFRTITAQDEQDQGSIKVLAGQITELQRSVEGYKEQLRHHQQEIADLRVGSNMIGAYARNTAFEYHTPQNAIPDSHSVNNSNNTPSELATIRATNGSHGGQIIHDSTESRQWNGRQQRVFDRKTADKAYKPSANRPCKCCGSAEHWVRDCPHRASGDVNVVDSSQVRGISCSTPLGKVYVSAKLYGKKVLCLLDNGCELSVIGKRYVENRVLKTTDQKLYAANETPIPLDGEIEVDLIVGGKIWITRMLVSDVIEEIVLGIDWLQKNQCCWNFASGKLHIGDMNVQLIENGKTIVIRRIYAAQYTIIRPGHQTRVPVKVTWSNLKLHSDGVVTKPINLARQVTTGRTLLDGSTFSAGLPVMNCSDEDFIVHKDILLGTAESV